MEEKTVSYIVYEGEQARNERHIKRLVRALIVAIALIFLSNAVWLYAWIQFDYTSVESSISLDAKDGTANYVGNDGSITYGTDNSEAGD